MICSCIGHYVDHSDLQIDLIIATLIISTLLSKLDFIELKKLINWKLLKYSFFYLTKCCIQKSAKKKKKVCVFT